MHKTRINGLRKIMAKRGLPAFLVSIAANRFYLSGFSAGDGQPGESSGALLITQHEAILLTDFRYQLSAVSQAVYYDVRVYTTGLAAELALLQQELGFKKMAVEGMGLLLAQKEQLAQHLDIELISTQGMVEELRIIKTPAEIGLMEKSLHIIERAMAQVFDTPEIIGQREKDLAHALLNQVHALGGDGFSFEPIVAGGANGAEPHAHAGSDPVRAEQPLVVDVGTWFNKYASDITRTYLPMGQAGPTAQQWREIYPIVQQAMQAAIEGIKPGMKGHEADDIARNIIEDAGYGRNFGHSLGHGVGLMVHEGPSLSPRSQDVLKPGMVFTIEPGIYLPGWGGVRLEQMVELTASGCRVLNQYNGFYSFES